MARLDRPGFKEWHAVVRRWVDAAFVKGESLITPGVRVWTLDNLNDLHHRYVDNPDEGTDDFWTKLQKQLASASAETTQLMAEVLYAYYLPMVGNLKLSTKVDAVQWVLNLIQPPVPLGHDLQHAFSIGIARESQNYIQQRYYQLKLIIEAAREWWKLEEPARESLLQDPWSFKGFLAQLPAYNNNAARQMLLYFVHTDSFEAIMAESDKLAIARALANDDEKQIEDDDQRILAIRQRLSVTRRAGFSFYEPDLKAVWKPERPSKATGGGEGSSPEPDDAGAQRRYWKIAPGKNAGEWDECLAAGVIRIGWDTLGDLTGCDWNGFQKRQAEEMAKHSDWSKNGSGQVWTFLAEVKKGDLIIANRGKSQIVGVGVVTGDYFYDPTLKVLKHCRSVNWYDSTTRRIKEQPWLRTLLELDKEQFESLVGQVPPDVADVESEEEEVVTPPQEPTGPQPDHPVVNLLLDRMNVVLHGPPGTGKTHATLQIAELWQAWQGDDAVSQVTFHPSYSYEDFIEGFRPDSTGKFTLRPGIFAETCKMARRQPKRKFLLVIDELNRGDVARIFGELITLIERDKRRPLASRKLPYSHADFFVPPNLYLLGTMNTADRSISLLDVAIRRRFCFVEFGPDPRVINHSQDHHQTIGSLDLGQLMLALNKRLQQIGIERDRALGHSYFLIHRNGANPLAELGSRIRHDIVPLVEEYCYANRSQMSAVLGEVIRDGQVALDVMDDDDRLLDVLMKLCQKAD